MPKIEILASGHIDDRDSAFPGAVQLPGGEILCSYSVEGGPNVYGGTHLSRSTDGGKTWTQAGEILAATENPTTANFLKLSRNPKSGQLFAYGARLLGEIDEKFGVRDSEPVYCTSDDDGETWSPPVDIPRPQACPLEISHRMSITESGRLLAPIATLPDAEHFGEKVVLAVSDDDGGTWGKFVTVFHDPEHRHAYFEHKFAEYAPGNLIAVAWTATFGKYEDQPNSFSLSHDNGETWSPARSTGIRGQTMCPVSLDGDRLLVLYNRRYGDQGIVAALVTFDDAGWNVHYETVMYDARNRREARDQESFTDEMDLFAFGFPTAIRLADGTFLATHWAIEEKVSRIHWTKLKVNWD